MNNKSLILSISLLFTLSGFSPFLHCANYKALPLEALSILSNEPNTLSFNHLKFSKKDCSRYLGRDKVIKRGFQPIQISFTNNTTRSLILNLDSFSLPCISAANVAEVLHFNVVSRVVGWTIGALFIWPLVIGAIVEGIAAPRANDKLEIDYAGKALKNQIVKPHTTAHGLIFVPVNNFHNDFSFSVVDVTSGDEFVLSVDCPIVKFAKKRNVLDDISKS